MMNTLIEASPSFEKVWLEFLDEWEDKKEDLPYYLVLGDYARHIKKACEENEKDSLRKIFCAIEKLHVEGDHYVREAATVGLLEALQNISSTQKGGTDVYVNYLLPESKYWWNKLNNFWAKGEVMVDDRN